MPLRAESMISGIFIPKRDYGLHVQTKIEERFVIQQHVCIFHPSHLNESIEIERTLADV